MTIMVSAQDVATAADFSENRTAMTEQANVPQNNTQASLRFGYLSYTSVLKLMPDYIAAQRNIDDLRTKYDIEMKRVENEFNQKYEQFLEGQHDFAPSILQKRQAELQELMDKNIAFKQKAQQLLKDAETKAYEPVYQRLDTVIQRVGQALGLAFILNTDAHAVPFINTSLGVDVTATIADAVK
ncbi:MAG: OmpH family outer membrane protein [Prevotella sp.]|nr:OmpH family outer membrane protein [Prevotella sp.]